MSMDLMVQAMKIKVGNPLRKLVLLKLADNASDLGECWPSYQHIADQCEISKRSVMNHIEALCECGLIKKELRTGPKGNSSNVYQLNLRSAGDSLPGAGDSPGGSAGAAPRISHSFEPVIESVNEPIKHTGASADASAPARSAKQDYSPEFEKAWQAYPKRAGGNSKAAAFKAWNARLKDGVKPEVMLAGVKRYAAYAQATGSAGTQYVKQAVSFFGPDRHFEESWQAPSAPAGGHNGTIARLSGLGRMSDDFGESGENLNF
ncbi:helix-turn-helix domain-containing protein [Klebsiella pneumoniae]